MQNQHVVILGGSSGIGLATARVLLQSSYEVTILGRDPDRLAHAAQELDGVTALQADAADRNSIQAAFSKIGPFDHLVLALGSRKGVGPFASVTIDDMRQGFEEKVFPQFQSAQLALPFLRPGGSLVFVSAVSAHAAAPGSAGIGAQNAAVSALVPILAAELKPLRVNGVAPGVIDTPWWDFMPEDQKRAAFAHFAGMTPLGRVGTPEDVAKTIAFLISADFVTGRVILCDGGMVLPG